MTIIELLFAVVLVGAVPLGLATIDLGDDALDRWVGRLAIAAWPAGAALAIGTLFAPSPLAVMLAVPWQLVTGSLALVALAGFARDPNRWRPSRRLAVEIALGFLAFGATNATSFAMGFAPLGFAPTIVLLTAVHFHAAGFVLVVAGILAFDRGRSPLGGAGVAALIVGTVITAAGFVGVPAAATVGAVTVGLGGLAVGWSTIRSARSFATLGARSLAILAGGALFISMPLAIAWAVGTQLAAPPFALDVMVRTHGAINAVLVTVPAMVGWTLDARATGR